MEEQNPLLRELVRLDTGISGFRQKPGETDGEFRGRVQLFGAFATFGARTAQSLAAIPRQTPLLTDCCSPGCNAQK
jgi:hypothetical protein